MDKEGFILQLLNRFFTQSTSAALLQKKGGIFIAAFSFPIVATVYWVMGKYSAVFLSL
jgi:hypothetical protein